MYCSSYGGPLRRKSKATYDPVGGFFIDAARFTASELQRKGYRVVRLVDSWYSDRSWPQHASVAGL